MADPSSTFLTLTSTNNLTAPPNSNSSLTTQDETIAAVRDVSLADQSSVLDPNSSVASRKFNNGLGLEFASERLRNDPDIILAAVTHRPLDDGIGATF